MDFDVGEWQDGKEMDKLNEALFGQTDSTVPINKKKRRNTDVNKNEVVTVKKKKNAPNRVCSLKLSSKKPKNKEEAIALAKARKHRKRKLKQKLLIYQVKALRELEKQNTSLSEDNLQPPKKNLQTIKDESAHDKQLSKGEKTKLKSKLKKEKLIQKNKEMMEALKPHKTPRNKYKHLAGKKNGHTMESPNSVSVVTVEKRDFHNVVAKKNSNQANSSPKEHSVFEEEKKSPKKEIKNKKAKEGVKKLTVHKHTVFEEENVNYHEKKKKHLAENSIIEVDNKKVEVVDVHCSKSPNTKKRQSFEEYKPTVESFIIHKKAKVAEKAKQEPLKVETPNRKSKFDIGKIQQLLNKEQRQKSALTEEKKVLMKDKTDTPKTLKEKMLEKLSTARFRYINEQLYTSSSQEAMVMMKVDPEAFHVYHQGFQAQVSRWPTNPLNLMVSYLSQRAKDLVVADLGCGDATLAACVKQKVYSFDLVATKDRITACDIANVPLDNDSVDVSVFCLSLMGTNLIDFIVEANRITKMGGILLIAEVVSRFEKVGTFIRKMEKVGFKLLNKDDSNTMFIWMEFKKTSIPVKDRLPKIELAPCTYKKR